MRTAYWIPACRGPLLLITHYVTLCFSAAVDHGRSKRARMKIGIQAYRLARPTLLAILLSGPMALRAKSRALAELKHRSRQTSHRFVCRMFARPRRLAAR